MRTTCTASIFVLLVRDTRSVGLGHMARILSFRNRIFVECAFVPERSNVVRKSEPLRYFGPSSHRSGSGP